MIGPADIEDMLMDYVSTDATHEASETQPSQMISWTWWLIPAASLAFEAQKVIQLRLFRLAWDWREG
ncbi:hypothetical protein SAMN02799631_05914 [Methylobacterium sp. 174MFSha1.1]|uniref:hypothetical protein n=1 Tax=Methylobacterium sp. 174MFSha1.1 TaxID=1502749 RepID=UPI0008E7615B|nr:hypothetical protein [Methylobacterium sp. 174MFSha1.1]SFV14587.1 hypothetical protein SAMN02799631_05914 [Methylobacterium sp. 174MFSha1.1]